MNSQIETWRVQQYAANVYQLSQQKGSKLASLVRNEIFTGKSEFFDRLGLAVAEDKVGRNENTPDLNIDHSRRMLTTVTRHWGTLVDRKDKVQNIHMPENEYSVAAQMALGRKMDDVIIAGALGNAYSGETGTTAVALGNAQKVTSVSSSALAYANVPMLRRAAYLLNKSSVVGKRYLIHDAQFLDQMLAHTETTSDEYAVKALISGEIKNYLGFEWVHCEQIASVLASDYDTDTYKFDVTTGLYSSGGTSLGGTEKCAMVMVGDGIILGKNPNAISRIDERSDKGYSTQVYASMDFGSTRMEEAKVVQLIYKA